MSVTSKAHAAHLTPRRDPPSRGFKPPARDLTADAETHRALAELDAALTNLRILPPCPPYDGEARDRWTAHRALLVQQIRNARRALQGFHVMEAEAPIGESPESLARAERIRAAERAAKTHSGRSPQHEDPLTGVCGLPFRSPGGRGPDHIL